MKKILVALVLACICGSVVGPVFCYNRKDRELGMLPKSKKLGMLPKFKKLGMLPKFKKLGMLPKFKKIYW